jgi:hypothetical protein
MRRHDARSSHKTEKTLRICCLNAWCQWTEIQVHLRLLIAQMPGQVMHKWASRSHCNDLLVYFLGKVRLASHTESLSRWRANWNLVWLSALKLWLRSMVRTQSVVRCDAVRADFDGCCCNMFRYWDCGQRQHLSDSLLVAMTRTEANGRMHRKAKVVFPF